MSEPEKRSNYVILHRDNDGWKPIATVAGTNPENALRNCIDPSAGLGGEFVAIPSRSWRPVTVSIHTEPKLVFERP